jgi:hypothetical protein
MLRTNFVRCLVVALILGSSLLSPGAWAAGKAPPQAAVATHAGPVAALWAWLEALLGKVPAGHGGIRPAAGGCIDPMGEPCVR